MPYTIPDNCFACGTCQPLCPTGAIHIDDGRYWIESGLCNDCSEYAGEPQCVVHCPISSPIPLQAKKGRYKAVERVATNPDLFSNGKNNTFASSMVIWEACKLLTSTTILPWQTALDGTLYYQRPVKQGRGNLTFRLIDNIELDRVDEGNYVTSESNLETIDIRSACLHLIYAAYATTLEKPWEQEFVIDDQQLEKYLGLDKRKDLSKATKLTLIKTLAQQPCRITAGIDWPQQGKIKGFSVEEDFIWHLLDIKHHFQEDTNGCKHLIGLTFTIRAGLWAKYFLNKQGYKQRTVFYQYGILPKFLLNTVMSIWQQHQGTVRMILWLLFKAKMGRKQSIMVPTLMNIAYGKEKITQAAKQREQRKRLIQKFESNLEVLNSYQLKPVFDPVTYPSEIQPLWAKLVELPDDADDAIDFWIQDGSQDQRLTDPAPRGKWNLLMQARILEFELPQEWEQQLAKFERKKQQRINKNPKSKISHRLSAEQILTARKRQGISQRELAQMIGKSQSWIRDLERGRFCAKPEDQVRLQKILNLH